MVETLAHARQRSLFPVAMCLHYVSASIYAVIAWNDDFNDPNRDTQGMLRSEVPYLVAFGVIYLCGQSWLWRSYAKHQQRLTHSSESIRAR